MANYTAVFTGVNAEIASSHSFEAGSDFLDATPFQVLVSAMEAVERANFASHHDYEFHAVSRNDERNVVMGIGYLVSGAGEIPFTLRVSQA